MGNIKDLTERVSAARLAAGLGILSVSVLAGAALARARRRRPTAG